jgi:hypothetical protein
MLGRVASVHRRDRPPSAARLQGLAVRGLFAEEGARPLSREGGGGGGDDGGIGELRPHRGRPVLRASSIHASDTFPRLEAAGASLGYGRDLASPLRASALTLDRVSSGRRVRSETQGAGKVRSSIRTISGVRSDGGGGGDGQLLMHGGNFDGGDRGDHRYSPSGDPNHTRRESESRHRKAYVGVARQQRQKGTERELRLADRYE